MVLRTSVYDVITPAAAVAAALLGARTGLKSRGFGAPATYGWLLLWMVRGSLVLGPGRVFFSPPRGDFVTRG